MTKQILLILSFIAYLGGALQGQSCWRSVSVGAGHVLALKSDGTLWTWGFNNFGQLGDGTSSGSVMTKRPIQIGTDNDWKIICAGSYFSMAIKNNGSLWSWGYNGVGQLGNGNTTAVLIPTRVGTDNDWKTISAAYAHCLGLKQNGTLWSWGDNVGGRLGHGNYISYTVPTQIGTSNQWTVAIAGDNISIALTNQDSLYAWGSNSNGSLGVGTTNVVLAPKRLVTTGRWRQVDAGNNSIMGIQMDGSLWGWGQNNLGVLGLGSAFLTSAPITMPTRVGTDNDWIHISVGKNNQTSFACKADKSIWGAGSNNSGQLGDSTIINRPEFKKIINAALTPFTTRFSGGSMAVIRSDSSLWMTGDNTYGQLGNNTQIARNVFAIVPCGTTAAQEVEKMPLWSLVPNPVTDAFYLKSDDAQECILKIVNTTGQIVLQGVYQTQQSIDIQSLPAGFYTLIANHQRIKFVKN
ncbi:MAG: hypothetical protein RL329_2687 [Bacteroidota bacterium]|jgi:alpha-tubulin suppressor-like RCC1 family protein